MSFSISGNIDVIAYSTSSIAFSRHALRMSYVLLAQDVDDFLQVVLDHRRLPPNDKKLG